MEGIYIFFIIILFLFALSDLVVGVSNDAVNFLNSSLGSKVAPFRTIIIIAALGILFGAISSSGMMEVARKGIFHPQHFAFSEIMMIFLAVMITDVILLDLFNTFGMPTSTTISIVFELLGAAFAMSIIKVNTDPNALALSEYINSSKALEIILGIFMSVIIAFVVGAIVQYISRLIFSFKYDKKLKYLGSVWGGIAVSAITFFILIKGAKHASFMTDSTKEMIHSNSLEIIIGSFVTWTIVFFLLGSILKKFNVLKFIVLLGTFSLALAFAGNDLVNFIGVPLAGLSSFEAFSSSGAANPSTFLMNDLQGAVETPFYYLLIAGMVMVATLWLSKKARSVTETEINLAKQGSGNERFNSFLAARIIVRSVSIFATSFNKLLPKSLVQRLEKQFNESEIQAKNEKLGTDAPAFDLLRASVNLVVASIIISIASSFKLPLSTTYVTFMVAMGTSLSDGAWGRESATYRVSGVLSVIGGWFFTAISAFTFAFIMANLFHFAEVYGIILMVLIASALIYRTHRLHKEKEDSKQKALEKQSTDNLSAETLFQKSTDVSIDVLKTTQKIFEDNLLGLANENLKTLKNAKKNFKQLDLETQSLKSDRTRLLKFLEEQPEEFGNYYIQSIDYSREILHCIRFINQAIFTHVDNHHLPLLDEQVSELKALETKIESYLKTVIQSIQNEDYSNFEEIHAEQNQISAEIHQTRKNQITRVKDENISPRNSILYFEILAESKNLVKSVRSLLRMKQEFFELKKDLPA